MSELNKIQIEHSILEAVMAWNESDLDKFMEFYCRSDSTMLVTATGEPVVGFDNIRNAYKKLFGVMTLSYEIFDIDILSPEYAYVVGAFTTYYKGQKEESVGRFSLVMSCLNGCWSVLKDHSTS